jgi:hypothetical protein
MTTAPRHYGRERLEAYQVSAEHLLLGGQQFTKEDLQKVQAPQSVLVQPPGGYARADELAQLQAAVQATLAQQTRAVRLKRTPQRRGKQWLLANKRIAASEVMLDEHNQPFVPRSYASVEDALQAIVFELDGVRSNGSSSDNSSSTSTLEN